MWKSICDEEKLRIPHQGHMQLKILMPKKLLKLLLNKNCKRQTECFQYWESNKEKIVKKVCVKRKELQWFFKCNEADPWKRIFRSVMK